MFVIRSLSVSLGDEALMIQGNRSDRYASIVASEQRAELFDRIGTLERDNMRLRGMLGVERQRVDRLRRSMSYYNDAEGDGDSLRLLATEINVTVDALSRKEQAKPLRVGSLVMTINSKLLPQIHEAQLEALKKKNVKDENLHVLDVFKDEGRLSEAIWFTSTTRNTPLEMGKYSHEFHHKPAKVNNMLLHDLGNRDHQKNYAEVRRKPLEFQVRGISVEMSDMFWQMRKAEPMLY
ncbi:hypothetical protein Tco_0465724 [Tanacetum coccineum]